MSNPCANFVFALGTGEYRANASYLAIFRIGIGGPSGHDFNHAVEDAASIRLYPLRNFSLR